MMQRILLRYAKGVVAGLFPDNFMLSRRRFSHDAVCLTFDDGPDPETTPLLLDILRDHRAQATFFVRGVQAERYPEIIRSIIAAGHEIGNHSFDHVRISEVGLTAYCRAVTRTSELLRGITGREIRLFRSPYGDMSPGLVRFIVRSGLTYVGWTLDSGDTSRHGAAGIAGHFRTLDIRRGEILLFHDDEKQTVAGMPAILRDLQGRGFSCEPLRWQNK